MTTVTVAKTEGGSVFRLLCCEPLTKCIPEVPPYDRPILPNAIDARPGAAMRQGSVAWPIPQRLTKSVQSKTGLPDAVGALRLGTGGVLR